jgi:hypothetical protein
VRCRPFWTVLPAYLFVFVGPMIVVMRRRRTAGSPQTTAHWVPGMPSDRGGLMSGCG